MKVLIVDDDIAVTNYLKVFLMQTEEHEPTVVNDSTLVKEMLSMESFDVMLVDVDMPEVGGMEILEYIQENEIAIAPIVLTGVSDIDLAVQAMKLGAIDYLTKPVEEDQLLQVLENAFEHSQVHRSIEDLPTDLTREELKHKRAFQSLLSGDKQIIRLFHLAEKLAMGDETIFITGERGTGKEHLAKAIHQASDRRGEKFVSLDAGMYDRKTLPVMLFGQAKDWSGSREEHSGFLEEANNGILYIDSIDQICPPTQLKLLRFIQKKEFYREGSTNLLHANVRIIAASDYDLRKIEASSTFDRNLLYHLVVNALHLPPLRERACDIPMLVEKFLCEETKKRHLHSKEATPEYCEILKNYFFPGNIYELQHIVASSVVFCEEDYLTVDSLPSYILENIEKGKKHPGIFKIRTLQEVEIEHIRKTLEHFQGNINECAKALDITMKELQDCCKKFKL